MLAPAPIVAPPVVVPPTMKDYGAAPARANYRAPLKITPAISAKAANDATAVENTAKAEGTEKMEWMFWEEPERCELAARKRLFGVAIDMNPDLLVFLNENSSTY